MAIANYTELQSAIIQWNHRDPGNVPDLITLAEKRINSELASRIGEVEVVLTATIGSRVITLPSGYMSNIGLWLTTYGQRDEILFVSPELIPVTTTSNGQPKYYTVSGSELEFEIPCSAAFTYDFRYKKGFDIATTTTNDILTNYPGLYLFGALIEAALFARDMDILSAWSSRFDAALSEAQRAEFKNKTQAFLAIDAPIVGQKRSNIYAGDRTNGS